MEYSLSLEPSDWERELGRAQGCLGRGRSMQRQTLLLNELALELALGTTVLKTALIPALAVPFFDKS